MFFDLLSVLTLCLTRFVSVNFILCCYSKQVTKTDYSSSWQQVKRPQHYHTSHRQKNLQWDFYIIQSKPYADFKVLWLDLFFKMISIHQDVSFVLVGLKSVFQADSLEDTYSYVLVVMNRLSDPQYQHMYRIRMKSVYNVREHFSF